MYWLVTWIAIDLIFFASSVPGICGKQFSNPLVSCGRVWKGRATKHPGSWDLHLRPSYLSPSSCPCCGLWQRPPLLLVSKVPQLIYVNVNYSLILDFRFSKRSVFHGNSNDGDSVYVCMFVCERLHTHFCHSFSLAYPKWLPGNIKIYLSFKKSFRFLSAVSLWNRKILKSHSSENWMSSQTQ